MIEQMMRAIEMVLKKQLELITGNVPTTTLQRAEGHGLGPKMELWVGVREDLDEYRVRQFKITVEEAVATEL